MQDSRPAAPRGKATILIVDDSPTIRKLVSMTLESRGYIVVVACDGVDGLAKLQEGMPDLILSDITMPRLDGYQFCKVVKSNKETKHIPVIMLSGNDGLFDKVRGRMAGSANYITKPFEPNNLVREIEKFVKAAKPAQAPPAPTRQPATAQGPPPAQQPRAAAPIDRPADPASAKQLSKKLSGIYIPGASSGSMGRPFEQQPAAAPPPRGNGDQQRLRQPPQQQPPQQQQQQPQQQQPQQQAPPAMRRPAPKRNDEPEIKIFYHNETQAPEPPAPQQSFVPSPPEQHNPAAQVRQNPAHFAPPQQPAAAAPGPSPQQMRPLGQPQNFKATCSGCGTVYANIKQEHIGKHARCKKCGTRFLITA